jgi:hypothetical protein
MVFHPCTEDTMRTALRSVLAMLAAFVVASILMMIVESINGKFLYPELGKAAEGMTDREAVRQLMAGAPIGALLVVLFGWGLGTLVGAVVAAKLAPRAPARHALALGILIALAGVANNLMIPPPAWFWIAGAAVPVAVGMLTARLVDRDDATSVDGRGARG